MKVHYKPKMIDKIRAEIMDAKRNNQEVDFIELNDKEMCDLRREWASMAAPKVPIQIRPFERKATFMGIPVVLESIDEDEDY